MIAFPQRQTYASDVNDEEWAFVAPYPCLLREDCGQRVHALREVFNGLRHLARAGCPRRLTPHDPPPWEMIYQQSQRWIKAEVFEVLRRDPQALLRVMADRESQPAATIFDGRTLQSTPESGGRAGHDGYKKKNGSKTHVAVDTLGHLPALHVTPANAQERDPVEVLSEEAREATHGNVQHAFVDQGYTGRAGCPGGGGSRH